MADPQIVNTLRTKKAEIERAIAHLERQIKAARVDLMHVNATLRLFEIDPDTRLQFPAHVDLNRLFKRGEMVDLCKEALAASAEPLTTRELAAYVVRAKGWDQQDKVLRSAIAYRIVQALRLQAKRGKIRSEGKVAGVRLWML